MRPRRPRPAARAAAPRRGRRAHPGRRAHEDPPGGAAWSRRRRLETQLFQDPLTRLYNRRFLFTQLGALASGARRHGRPLAVAMVDLDALQGGQRRARPRRRRRGAGRGGRRAAALAARRGRARPARRRGVPRAAPRHATPRPRRRPPSGCAPRSRTPRVRSPSRRASAGPCSPATRRPTTSSGGPIEALYAAKDAGRDRVRGPATLPRRT